MRAFSLGVSLALLVAAAPAQAQNGDPLVLNGTKYRPYQQQDNCPPGFMPAPSTIMPSPAADPKTPVDPNAKQPDQPPVNNAGDQFAGATETGTQPGAMFNPNVFGDLIGISGRSSLNNIRRGATRVSSPGVIIKGQYQGFKVTDNESPRPVDRIFFTYNNYSDVNRSTLPAGTPAVQLQRQLIGFEKTFLGGDASFGMRLPFVQISGFSDVQSHEVGDLSMIFKYAFYNDRQSGNLASGGLVLTLPTGGGTTVLSDGTNAPHATLFQPWAGGIYNLNRGFVQGFASLVVPTDGRDPTILFNSVAAGYWLYRSDADRLLTGFVPVAELHLNTPLNHRSTSDPIYFQDQLNLTTGAYVLFPRMVLGGAVGVPLVGPKPFNLEAIASLNFKF